jgi:AcrR family transcriptional regulator
MALSAIWHQVPSFAYPAHVRGLRETKKANTSQAIVDAAMELFKGRHFSDVSVDEIAAAAGIGRRTFFRYFPTKEDVFLDRRRIDRGFATAALRARTPEEDDVAVIMRVLAELQRRGFAAFGPQHQLELHRLTHFEPELAARSWLLMEEVREIVVAGLMGPEADQSEVLRARVLASACIMVFDVGITTWIEGGMREDLPAILAQGAEHLREGFATEGRRGGSQVRHPTSRPSSRSKTTA